MAAHRDALALIAEDEYWRAFSLSHPKLITRVILNGISIQSRNPVDVVEKLAYRRKIGIPDECRFVVGAVGRLGSDRKPWMYLPIFAEIARECGPDIHFVLAGGGAELNRMKSLVIEQRLQERVHLPGMVLEPTLPLAVMDLYISVNVGATTGLAGMEAAQSGLPVIAIQWVDGYQADANDWIWSSADLIEVAKHACDLLRSSTDRQALAERQRSYVESHHTVDAMAHSYYALYQAAIVRLGLLSD
jgi:glycosyltransferase involved in cell wall biosynthesis